MIANPSKKFNGQPFRYSAGWRVAQADTPENAEIPPVQYSAYIAALKHDPCVWCNHTGGTRDHIQPRSCGGSDGWSNIAGACSSCNGTRGSLSILQYLLVRQIRHYKALNKPKQFQTADTIRRCRRMVKSSLSHSEECGFESRQRYQRELDTRKLEWARFQQARKPRIAADTIRYSQRIILRP